MGDLSGYEKDTFTFDGKTRDVYRKGTGPGRARVRRDARHHAEGARLRRPGRRPSAAPPSSPTCSACPGAEPSVGKTIQAIGPACVSKEFSAWATGKTSPVIAWCKALAREEHERNGGPGVGVVGMCFTGNFALAMLPEPAVQAPVLSQPSLPLGFTKKARRGLYISEDDLGKVQARMARGARPVPARPPVHRRPRSCRRTASTTCARRWATGSWPWRSTRRRATRTGTRRPPTRCSPST